MSSEPPPNPITNVFNVTDWIHVASSGGGNSDFATNSTNSVNTQNVNITSTDSAGTYYPTFVGATSGNNPELVDSNMTYNPSTNTLTVGTLVGAVSGNITNAVTSDKVVIASNVADNQSYYPTFVTGSVSSSLPVLTGTMRYNPFSDTFTATNITATGTLSGTFTGTIATATTANNVKIAQTASTDDFYPMFASTYATTSTPVYGDQDLKYNPSTNTLTVPTLTATVINGTASNAVNAENVYNSGIGTPGNYGIAYFGTNAIGNATLSSDISNHLTYNPDTNVLSATGSITAASMTINGTGTALSLPSATAISAPNATISASQFSGALSGTATTANNVKVDASAANTDLFLTFSDSTTSASTALKADADLKYNPLSNTLAVPNLTVGGTITGTVATATTATGVNITAESSSSNFNYFPTFVGGTSGSQTEKVNGSLIYNPFSNTLTAGTFSGYATVANTTVISEVSAGSTYYPTFVNNLAGNLQQLVDADFTFNCNTNTLTVPNVTVTNTLTATVGSATTASKIVVANNSTTNTDYLPLFTTASGSSQTVSTDTSLTYNPNSNLLTVPNLTVSGTLSGTVTTATNANNINIQDYSSGGGNFYLPFAVGSGLNAIGIDTTLVYNGTSNTLTIPNLTVSGTLTATVTSTTASNIVVTDNSTTNTNYLPLFTTAAGSSQAASVDTGFTYNPNSNTLTATNITATGTLSGTFGGTIANATNAINTGITAVTTGTTYYPTFVSATSGNNPQLVDTDLQFNSATNTLTCPTVNLNTIATGSTSIGIGAVLSPTYTIAADSTQMNTITSVTTTAVSNINVNLTLMGQTQFIYRTVDSAAIANYTNTNLFTTTMTNTGIYTVCYHTRYAGSGFARGVQTWIYVSSPAQYGSGGYNSGEGQLALNLVGYASPYLDLLNVGVCFGSSWTGMINAGATVRLTCFIEYNSGSGAKVGANSSNNYLSFTRIA
jgi:hypothetical protein